MTEEERADRLEALLAEGKALSERIDAWLEPIEAALDRMDAIEGSRVPL